MRARGDQRRSEQERGSMTQGRLMLLAGSCLVALLTVATADIALPQVVRVPLGVLLVFVLPGFALVCAVLPMQQFSRGERLLASVGMSLALAVGAAVLLGAMPIGLSRLSLAVVLGGCTLMFSIYAVFRTGVGRHERRSHEGASKETGS
jgi:uncharacterized membrane protein